MNAKTIFTFAGGLVSGLVIGVLLFSGSPQPGGTVTPAPQNQPQVDVLAKQQEIARLEEMIRQDPNNYRAWKQMADNLFDIGEHQRSVEAYRKALDLDGSDANVWTDMGIMYRELGQFDKALEAFTTAARKLPTHVQSRLNMGVVYIYDLQDYEKGFAAWEEFLRLEPTGQRADGIRAEMQQFKVQQAMQEGGGLPTDHPPIEDGAAPAPSGTEGFFPKPGE